MSLLLYAGVVVVILIALLYVGVTQIIPMYASTPYHIIPPHSHSLLLHDTDSAVTSRLLFVSSFLPPLTRRQWRRVMIGPRSSLDVFDWFAIRPLCQWTADLHLIGCESVRIEWRLFTPRNIVVRLRKPAVHVTVTPDATDISDSSNSADDDGATHSAPAPSSPPDLPVSLLFFLRFFRVSLSAEDAVLSVETSDGASSVKVHVSSLLVSHEWGHNRSLGQTAVDINFHLNNAIVNSKDARAGDDGTHRIVSLQPLILHVSIPIVKDWAAISPLTPKILLLSTIHHAEVHVGWSGITVAVSPDDVCNVEWLISLALAAATGRTRRRPQPQLHFDQVEAANDVSRQLSSARKLLSTIMSAPKQISVDVGSSSIQFYPNIRASSVVIPDFAVIELSFSAVEIAFTRQQIMAQSPSQACNMTLLVSTLELIVHSSLEAAATTAPSFRLFDVQQLTLNADGDMIALSALNNESIKALPTDHTVTIRCRRLHVRAHPIIVALSNTALLLFYKAAQQRSMHISIPLSNKDTLTLNSSLLTDLLTLHPPFALIGSIELNDVEFGVYDEVSRSLVQLLLTDAAINGKSVKNHTSLVLDSAVHFGYVGIHCDAPALSGPLPYQMINNHSAVTDAQGATPSYPIRARHACALGVDHLSLPIRVSASSQLTAIAINITLQSIRLTFLSHLPATIRAVQQAFTKDNAALIAIIRQRIIAYQRRQMVASSQLAAPVAAPSPYNRSPTSATLSLSSIPRPLSPMILPTPSSNVIYPYVFTCNAEIGGILLEAAAPAPDGVHAVSLHVGTIITKFEMDLIELSLSGIRRHRTHNSQSSSVSVQSFALTIHNPYRRIPTSLRQGEEILALGRFDLLAVPRDDSHVVDSIRVRIASAGFSWNLQMHMAIFQVEHAIKHVVRDVKGEINQLTAALLGPAAPFMRSASTSGANTPIVVPPDTPSSRSSLPIILISVESVAGEVDFTEFKSESNNAHADTPADSFVITPTVMTFFASKLQFAHPSATRFVPHPSTPHHEACPYPMSVNVGAGWWCTQGIPIMWWEHMSLGAANPRGVQLDLVGNISRGVIRFQFDCKFGQFIDAQIITWKGFKMWRIQRRKELAEEAAARGEPVPSLPEEPFSVFPKPIDLDFDNIWLRLFDCRFEVCDNPVIDAALADRRGQLSEAQRHREDQIRQSMPMRYATTGVKVRQDLAHDDGPATIVSPAVSLSRSPSHSPLQSDPPIEEKSSKTRSANDTRFTAAIDAKHSALKTKSTTLSSSSGTASTESSSSTDERSTNVSSACSLVRDIVRRTFDGADVVPFPPPSPLTSSSPLFAVTAPDITGVVNLTKELFDVRRNYQSIRSLDPAPFPPYLPHLLADEEYQRSLDTGEPFVMPPLETSNTFLEMWGRTVALHAVQLRTEWRDFPLPLLIGQSFTGNGTIYLTQMQAPHRFLFIRPVCLANVSGGSGEWSQSGGKPISVDLIRGSFIPMKLYYDLSVSGVEIDASYGMCHVHTFTAMSEAFNKLSPPALPRVGPYLAWWDDLRMRIHGRLKLNATALTHVRLIAHTSPYRRDWLDIKFERGSLTHETGRFSVLFESVELSIVSDSMEGIYEESYRSPDYINGHTITVPILRLEVETDWRCRSLPDGTEMNSFMHHVQHLPHNSRDVDVYYHFRAVALHYRAFMLFDTKSHPFPQHPNSDKGHSTLMKDLQHNDELVLPEPLSPQPYSPFARTHTPRVYWHQPYLTLRWSALKWIWDLIMIFCYPPPMLMPIIPRIGPSLGELMQSLSFSGYVHSPRIEFLCETAEMNGRMAAMMWSAHSFALDFMLMAAYDETNLRSLQIQDRALDIVHVAARSLVFTASRDEHAASVTSDELRDKAVQRQLEARADGRTVNFTNAEGRFVSPFSEDLDDYTTEYFLTSRVFAYRTHYPDKSTPQRNSTITGSATVPLNELPPFDMTLHKCSDITHWDRTFSDLMQNRENDETDGIWEGNNSAQSASPSANSVNTSDNDDDILRNQTPVNISQRDDGKIPAVNVHIPTSEQFASDDNNRSAAHKRDSPFPITSGPTFSTDLLDDEFTSLPIYVGATRGRTKPLQQPRDYMACQHRYCLVNFKLLWTNTSQRAIMQWYYIIWPKPVNAATNNKESAPPPPLPPRPPAASNMATALPTTPTDATTSSPSPSPPALHVSTSSDMTNRIRLDLISPLSSMSQTDFDVLQEHRSIASMDMMALVNADESNTPPVENTLPTTLPKEVPVQKPIYARQALLGRPSLPAYLKPFEHRRDDDRSWLTLYEMDFVRPQITFQSRDTNSRLVLAASKARLDNLGLPVHVYGEDNTQAAMTEAASPTSDTLLPSPTPPAQMPLALSPTSANDPLPSAAALISATASAAPVPIITVTGARKQVEDILYYEIKRCVALQDAQAFVSPIDIEGDGRVQWASDHVVQQSSVSPITTKLGSVTPPTVDDIAVQPHDPNESVNYTGIVDENEAANDPLHIVISHELSSSTGVLRKIVEPCAMFFANAFQLDIENDLSKDQLVIADSTNGVLVKAKSKYGKILRAHAAALSKAQSDGAKRVLSECIQAFLPSFDGHLDSNELWTLVGVVQSLFLSEPTSDVDVVEPPKRNKSAERPPDKKEFRDLIERCLQASDGDEYAEMSGTRRVSDSRKIIRKLVQYYLGGSTWQLMRNGMPFIAANMHGLTGNHTFYADQSCDNEFNIEFLTLHSRVLDEGDPDANLLIPDPDRWVERDHRRDCMVRVRAQMHAPLAKFDPALQHVTVYDHFEISLFPLVIRFPYDHYLMLRQYIFPNLSDDRDHEKKEAEDTFFNVRSRKQRSARETTRTANPALTIATERRADSQPNSPQTPDSARPAGEHQTSQYLQRTTNRKLQYSSSFQLPAPATTRRELEEKDTTAQRSAAKTVRGKRGSTRPVIRRQVTTAKRVDSTNYFRYLRVGELNFLISYHGTSSLLSLDSVKIVISPFAQNQRAWTWTKLLLKVEKHVKSNVYAQANTIISSKFASKRNAEGTAVQSLSKKFMDLFAKPIEDERATFLHGHERAATYDQANAMSIEQQVDMQRTASDSAGAESVEPSSQADSSTPLTMSGVMSSGVASTGKFVHSAMDRVGVIGDSLASISSKAKVLFGSKANKTRRSDKKPSPAAVAAAQAQTVPSTVITSPTVDPSTVVVPPTIPSRPPPLPSKPPPSFIRPLSLPSSGSTTQLLSVLETSSSSSSSSAPPGPPPLPDRPPKDLGMLKLLKKKRAQPPTPHTHVTSPHAHITSSVSPESSLLASPSSAASLTTPTYSALALPPANNESAMSRTMDMSMLSPAARSHTRSRSDVSALQSTPSDNTDNTKLQTASATTSPSNAAIAEHTASNDSA